MSSDEAGKADDPYKHLFKDDMEAGKYIRQLAPDVRTIFDVGASTGVWSYYMSKVFPQAQFELFEPLIGRVKAYEASRQYLEMIPHARLHAVAAGAKAGTLNMEMVTEANPYIATGLDLGADSTGTIAVPVVTLDETVASGQAPQPDIIKVDVQGLERHVMEGARAILPETRFVMLETWTFRYYGGRTDVLRETLNYMFDFGFSPLEVSPGFRDEIGRLVNVDVWFVNRAFAGQIGMETE